MFTYTTAENGFECPPVEETFKHYDAVKLPSDRTFKYPPKPSAPHRRDCTVFTPRTLLPWSKLRPNDEEIHFSQISTNFPIYLNTSHEIESFMRNYNNKIIGPFKALESLINLLPQEERTTLFCQTIPSCWRLAKYGPDFFLDDLPQLESGFNCSLTISQAQAAILIANCFFNTFQDRNNASVAFGLFGMHHVMASESPCAIQKCASIIEYLQRCVRSPPVGLITYSRFQLDIETIPEFKNNNTQLLHNITLVRKVGAGLENAYPGTAVVDFANEFPGGGALGNGTAQEELLFYAYPELLILQLVAEKMAADEVLLVTGAQKFSDMRGYGSTFSFHKTLTPSDARDSYGRAATQFIVMDAQPYNNREDQFRKRNIDRELIKSYTGFCAPTSMVDRKEAISTGHWGCGVFRGDKPLKFALQIISASLAGRDGILYHVMNTDNDYKIIEDLLAIIRHKHLTVGALYKEIVSKDNKGSWTVILNRLNRL